MRKIKDLYSASRADIVDLKFFQIYNFKKCIHITLFTSLQLIKLRLFFLISKSSEIKQVTQISSAIFGKEI